MNKVAKLVIVDNQGKYLLMHRSEHPRFGTDPDLPGGTLEGSEEPIQTMLREVLEEAGVVIDRARVEMLYSGTNYSTHGTHYSLFFTKLDERPEITLSWEHSSYEWLSRDDFRKKARNAKDTYMHMAYDVLKDAHK
jgi:8-oxo-dGTP pyrophosphatase MutT (NUDIX family)